MYLINLTLRSRFDVFHCEACTHVLLRGVTGALRTAAALTEQGCYDGAAAVQVARLRSRCCSLCSAAAATVRFQC